MPGITLAKALALLLAHERPDFVALHIAAVEAAQLRVQQLLASLANGFEQAHDRIPVEARQPFGGANRAAFKKALHRTRCRIRIAAQWSNRKDGKGFTFYLSDYWSEKRKRWEVNRFRPGIARTSIDSKKSFYGIGFTEGTADEVKEYRRGRFLDVRTLAFVLTNRSHSLESLCKTLGAAAELEKSEYVSGSVSPEKIKYCRRDVTATVWCLNALKKEFDLHSDLSLHPDRA